jgi:hypothetical protein
VEIDVGWWWGNKGPQVIWIGDTHPNGEADQLQGIGIADTADAEELNMNMAAEFIEIVADGAVTAHARPPNLWLSLAAACRSGRDYLKA